MGRSRIGGLWGAIKCRLLGRSDVTHWSDSGSFDAEWDERSRVAASLIPAGAAVLEFGAGLRRLEKFTDPGVSYTPSDLVDRGPGTLLIDLNVQPFPTVNDVDTAVFCGVLEYLTDVPAVVRWLSEWASVCIASYNCAHSSGGTLRRAKEVGKRTACGWVNTFTEPELCALFTTAGFELVERRRWNEADDNEPIFCFRRRPGKAL